MAGICNRISVRKTQEHVITKSPNIYSDAGAFWSLFWHIFIIVFFPRISHYPTIHVNSASTYYIGTCLCFINIQFVGFEAFRVLIRVMKEVMSFLASRHR